MAVGDLNGDGILDIIVAGALATNTTGNYVSTFLGDGSGNLALKETTLLGTGAVSGEIAVVDFNEDASLDVALPIVSNQDTNNLSHTVRLFFGDGSGRLVEQAL